MSKFSDWFGWFKRPAVPTPQPVPPPISQNYSVSPRGIAFVKLGEGFRDASYVDAGGVWTIGYGTTRVNGVPVTQDMDCTVGQATQWLQDECDVIARFLQKTVTGKLTQNQIDALVDFCYNLGTGAFAGSSLCKAINNKQPIAEDLFTRWNKIHRSDGEVVALAGLTKRRQLEYQLFIS